MAMQDIDIDTVQPNGKRGDPARVMAQKINANFALLDPLLSPCSISNNGLLLSFAGSTLTLSSGFAYIPSLGGCLAVPTALSKVLSGMTPNTWYHVYLFAKADGTPDFEVVTVLPSAPYFGTARTKGGDNSRRYVGSVRVGAGGILKFEHHPGQIYYLEDTNASPFLVVAAGSSTSTTTVSAAQVAPVTAYAVFLNALNAATNGAYVRLSNSKGPSAQSGYIALASPGGVAAVTMPVDGAQAYTYAFDNSPSPIGSAYHRINGYFFDR